MASLGIPVPPGYTVTTEAHKEYLKTDPTFKPRHLDSIVDKCLNANTELDYVNHLPPLLSVRSGSPISMPGMMDTILNVGINSDNLEKYGEVLGTRTALDCYRRLIQMISTTAYGVDNTFFEKALRDSKDKLGYKYDSDLTEKDLVALISTYKNIFTKHCPNTPFPEDLHQQLAVAIKAVFDSWDSPRAKVYRAKNNIPEDLCTAVNIQSMVFGNTSDISGSGVVFTRCPSTGENVIFGEYLPNAQGEDVVSGIRTPYSLSEFFEKNNPSWKKELNDACAFLESFYDDMVDVEFTVQEGKLYILQSRVGKRSAQAAIRIAMDMYEAGTITKEQVFERVSCKQYTLAQRSVVCPTYTETEDYKGLPASGGVASGKPVFSSSDAVNCTEPCILICKETTPEDIEGMYKSVGIITKEGGATSHAAVVARAIDTPCVTGCTTLDLDQEELRSATKVTIDGLAGKVWVEKDVPIVDNSSDEYVSKFKDLGLSNAPVAPVDLLPLPFDVKDRPAIIDLGIYTEDLSALEALASIIANIDTFSNVCVNFIAPELEDIPNDDFINFCFTSKKDYIEIQNAAISAFCEAGEFNGLSVRVSPEANKDLLIKKGCIVVEPLTKVVDLYRDKSKTIFVGNPDVTRIFSSWEDFKTLHSILDQAMDTPKLVLGPLPEDYIIFTKLR